MGRKKQLKKEEIAEDWCFVCKDGGSLRICDYRNCLKSYHPECVNEDDSLLESEVPWNCNLHSCSECNKAPKFYCLCCPSALCQRCRYGVNFSVVRGNKGLCNCCLELVVLIEEDKDIDSDGVKVDFNAEDTAEFLFKGYWQIIKEQEGLTSEHVISVYNQLRDSKSQGSASDLSEYDEGEDAVDEFEGENQLTISDDDGSNDNKEHRKSGKRKRSKGKLSSIKKRASSKKKFVGWGSKPLLEFLASMGKDTTHELSQYDVTNIIIEYCKENNLFHPKRKKTIICDARLQPLLGRKSLNRNNLYNRLSSHFAENLETSEDEFGSSSEDVDENVLVVGKREKCLNLVKKTHVKEVVVEVQKSCFASIVPKNIRLVYLRKSLVQELSRQLDTFDSKVTGSFVRVKSDPNDYLQKNSHQLVQVIGVKKNSEMKSDILLQVSNMVKDVPICKLSDDDFSEEECEDLCQRVKNGLLKRPTVVELHQKAKILHEDIIKHWIARELVSLQKRIDRANEKGWRRELEEYMESLLLLQTPSEQSRLLHEVPEVIADIIESEPAYEKSTGKDELEHPEGSPETAPRRTSKHHSSNFKGTETSCCTNDLTDAKGDGDILVKNCASGATEFGSSCKYYKSGEAYYKISTQKDTKGETQTIASSDQLRGDGDQPQGVEAPLSTAESLVDDEFVLGSNDSKKRGQGKSKDVAQGHGKELEICNGRYARTGTSLKSYARRHGGAAGASSINSI